MAGSWGYALAGFVGGAGGQYSKIKKEQREWNMDQMTKQADMERQLHLDEVVGERQTRREQELTLWKQKQELEQTGLKAAKEAEIYMTPEQKALREQQSTDAVSQATKVAKAEAGVQLETFKAKLKATSKQAIEDKTSLIQAAEKELNNMNLSPELKDTYKSYIKLAAFGVTLPDEKVTKLKPEDYRKARESAVTEAETRGITDAASASKALIQEGLQAGKDFQEMNAYETYIARTQGRYLLQTDSGVSSEEKPKKKPAGKQLVSDEDLRAEAYKDIMSISGTENKWAEIEALREKNPTVADMVAVQIFGRKDRNVPAQTPGGGALSGPMVGSTSSMLTDEPKNRIQANAVRRRQQREDIKSREAINRPGSAAPIINWGN